MKQEDKKHPQKWCLLSTMDAWHKFKAHTMFLDDEVMRDRILAVIQSAFDNPFAIEIRYHTRCWKTYMKPIYSMEEENEARTHLQMARLVEVQEIFFQHVRYVILELKEPRTLQGLLTDYTNLLSNRET
jgi:hypothetical protein